MKKEVSICCICGEEYPSAQSNNPFPIRPEASDSDDTAVRCCNDCNDFFVQRGRAILRNMKTQEEYDKCIEWFNSMSLEELDDKIALSTRDAVEYFRKKIM